MSSRKVRILVFSGSVRTGSFNQKLAELAAAALIKAGAETQLISLRDFPLPLYDADLETREGMPASAQRLRELMSAQDGLWISSPEYNSQYSPMLKNTIDWVSRGRDAHEPFRNKVLALTSASPGALGGLRGLMLVRALLSHLGFIALPTQISISKAAEAFDAAGQLKDSKQQESVQKLAEELVRVAGALTSG